MAHDTLIGGISYSVTGGKALVSGVQRNIKKGRALKDGVGQDIGFGMPLTDVPVGGSVFLNVDGVPKEFLIVHVGNPDTSLYDASCDGVWLLMKDLYESRCTHATAAGDYGANHYGTANIHSYLNGTLLGLFDSDIQPAIQEVKIPTLQGRATEGIVASGSNGLSAKIFLLSGYECNWTIEWNIQKYIPVDGTCLDYFAGCTKSDRIAYLNGTATAWWTRSAFTDGGTHYWIFSINGEQSTLASSENAGVRPALILPHETMVDDEYNVIVA